MTPNEDRSSPDMTADTRPAVAVVAEDPTLRAQVRSWIEAAGFDCVELDGGRGAMEIDATRYGAVCLDASLGQVPSLRLVQLLRGKDADLPVVLLSVDGGADPGADAIRRAAYDEVARPVDRERLVRAVTRAAEKRELAGSVTKLRRELDSHTVTEAVVGDGTAIRELLRQVERLVETDASVCLQGESGSGRELVARRIHDRSRRSAAAFVAFDCAATPAPLHEAELFGLDGGGDGGRFAQAVSGTLFLDSVDQLSPSAQARLARSLGGADLRLLCATTGDLRSAAHLGRLRDELLPRVCQHVVLVPPLRAHIEDAPSLVSHFLSKLARDLGRPAPVISPEVFEAIQRYPWPGNVRELKNVLHRAMLATDGVELRASHLPPEVRGAATLGEGGAANLNGSGNPGSVCLADLEQDAIKRALKITNGSVGKAAKLLGMGRATLYRRLAALGLSTQEMREHHL